MEFRRVSNALPPRPASDGPNQIGRIERDAFDAAEIDQANASIGLEQVIARMMVGMK